MEIIDLSKGAKKPVRLSRSEFLRRLPSNKRIQIRQLKNQTKQNHDPVIEDGFAMLEASAWVEPTHPDTVELVGYLLSQGHITQAEADKLLLDAYLPGETGP